MTTRKKTLTHRLQALDGLLEDPHPHDQAWSDELLAALEAIYELALHPAAAAGKTGDDAPLSSPV